MEKPDIGSRGPDVSILSYHGNKFVSGLFWRPLSSQRQYMKEARKLGKEEHLDIVAIRHSPTVIQAGFVSKSQGAVKGMYSWPRRFQASSKATSWPAGRSTRTATHWSPRSMVRSSPARTWSLPSTKPGTGSGSSLRAACFETHRSSFPKDSISPSRTSTSRNCSRRSACGATTASGNSPSACPPESGRQWPCSVAW